MPARAPARAPRALLLLGLLGLLGVLGLQSLPAHVVALDLVVPPAQREKCVRETFDPDTVAHVRARVSAQTGRPGPGGARDFAARMQQLDAGSQGGGVPQIAMQVRDERTNSIMFDSRAIPTGYSREFAVASIATRSQEMRQMDPENGGGDEEFSICFTDLSPVRRPDPGTRVELQIEVQKSATPAFDPAVSTKLTQSEQSLQAAIGLARSLESEVLHAKQREMRHRDTSESTNARVATYSWLSFAVLAGLGVTQMLYLRQFFKSKHIVS